MKKYLFLIVAAFIFSVSFAQKGGTQLDRSIRPIAGPPPEIKIGENQSFVLPNGLKVFIVENHKQPVVGYTIVLDIQPALEDSAAGTAEITSQLMTSGTKNRTKDQFDNEIDFIGADLFVTPKYLFANALKKQQTKLLELISDILLNPNFQQTELDKLKNKKLSELASLKDNPDAISNNVKAVLNFGKQHTYGELITEKTVSNINIEKCNTYFQTYYRPNVAYMAIVGDITMEEIKPLIEKYFGSWQKAEVVLTDYASPLPPTQTRVALVNKPGAVQSVINVTYPVNLKPSSEDIIKVRVMNTILGGGMGSRLFTNLREKHGYTYGAYSSINSDRLASQFTASAKVRNAVTDSSVTEILNELKRIRSEKVPQDELDGIKNNLNGQFAISLEDPSTIARFAINTEMYKLPKDYYKTYLKNLAAVTSDDVYAMAQKYIHPENATILVVGNQEELSKKMAPFSATNNIEFYDFYGNPINSIIKEIPLEVTAKSVISDYVNAIGGAKAWMKVKNISTTMNTQIQGTDISIVTVKKAPNKYAMQVKMGETILQKEVYDGTVAKQQNMEETSELTGESLDEIKWQALIRPEMNYEKSGYKLNLKGIEAINGKDAYIMEVISPKGKKIIEWYDVESKLKIRSLQTITSETGEMTNTTDILQYRDIEGLKVPSVISISGQTSMRLTADSILINKEIADTEFIIKN